MVLFVYDKATLDEEDISAAQLLVFGKAREPAHPPGGRARLPHAGAHRVPHGRRRRCSTTAAAASASRSSGPAARSPPARRSAARAPGKLRGPGWKLARRRRVAVFGGSFNPPHVGHLLGVVYALATAPIDEVLVVPVYQHPFAKHLAPLRRPARDVPPRRRLAARA